MSDDGGVLSQAEIDAVFQQATGKDVTHPPAASGGASQPSVSPPTPSSRPPASQPTVPSAPPLQTPAPVPYEVLQKLQAAVADLASRMTKVETTISRLSRAEGEATDISVTVQRLSQRLETIAGDLHKVNGQTSGILAGLDATPDYGTRKSFICDSCHSRGFVAIPMKCTQCGKEGWWGWWPKIE